MNKPFKIYHNDQGQITTLTTEDLDGAFVIVSADQFDEVLKNISRWQVIDSKLVNVKKVTIRPPTLQFTDEFDTAKSTACYMVQKNNLFLCEQSVTIKPKDFDDTKYSWVKYDS